MGSREVDPIVPKTGPADRSHLTQGITVQASESGAGSSLELPQSNFNPFPGSTFSFSSKTRTKTRKAPRVADSPLLTVG